MNDIALIEKLANLGALGILLALAVVFLVKLGERLLKVFEDRIAFLETGALAALTTIADRNAEHDRKSAEAHLRQDAAAKELLTAIERIERKVS